METLETCKTLENKYDPKAPTSATCIIVARHNLSPPWDGVISLNRTGFDLLPHQELHGDLENKPKSQQGVTIEPDFEK